ncbi:MAG TPA: RNA pseudouridine synthase [Verrucomicrobiae bacterium]
MADFLRLEKLFNIIREDAELLVVHKPADLVCHPTKGDEYSSLISRARIYLERQDRLDPLPSAVSHPQSSPHLIHRLDRETSGLVVIAKNHEAARELGKIWESRAVQKEYLAIVHGHIAAELGTIDAPLGRDETSAVAIKDCVRADGALAQTEFHVEKRFARQAANFTLVRVAPRTGRKHQIRIHLAHLGHPVVGDKIYGGDADLYLALVENRLTDGQRARLVLPNHALHAGSLKFQWRGRDWHFTSPPEPPFLEFCESEN